jgi:hypothetical protein
VGIDRGVRGVLFLHVEVLFKRSHSLVSYSGSSPAFDRVYGPLAALYSEASLPSKGCLRFRVLISNPSGTHNRGTTLTRSEVLGQALGLESPGRH